MPKDSVQTASVDAPVAPVTAGTGAGLPRQRAVTPDENLRPSRVLRALLQFHLHGNREPSKTSSRVWPALLHPFRDMRSIRHEYPVLIPGTGGVDDAQPLISRIDEIVNQSGLEGDPRERMRRHAYQFEAALKDALAGDLFADLKELSIKVSKQMLESSSMEDARKAVLRSDLDLIIARLPDSTYVADCSQDIPARLYRGVGRQFWTRHCEQFRTDLEQLSHRLGGILRANAEHKPEARSADHLRNVLGSSGRQDLDFDRMSELLEKTPKADILPAERYARISEAQKTLRAMFPVYGLSSTSEAPFDMEAYPTSVADAVLKINQREAHMVAFFRAIRIAELELENQYDPATHDGFFNTFSYTHLSEEERSLCPPVILNLSQDDVTLSDAGELMELLDSDAAIKVVLQLTSLDSGECSDSPAWPLRLAAAAMSLGSAYVFQGTSSNPNLMRKAFAAGAAYLGPALFSVYTSAGGQASVLPAYLDAASALESRALPTFRFNPAKGPDLAQRMRLDGNPMEERAWVSDIFSFMNESAEESAVELTYTHADFLLTDTRWQKDFWVLDHEMSNDALLPLDEFIALDVDKRRNRVPYILAVDEKDDIRKVVINYRVLRQVETAANRWRALQEAGGIKNSHAEALMAAEQARMEEQLQARLAELQAETESQLDTNLGDLTREIVGRIAGQLISGASMPAGFTPSPSPARPAAAPAKVAAPTEDVVEPAEEEEEDDAPISLDEPYIDTPLCTSCDDCTKMSPHIFAYDGDKQAYIKDASAGSFQELVLAAEKCPVAIIHPGKPKNPNEDNLDEWIARAKPFN